MLMMQPIFTDLGSVFEQLRELAEQREAFQPPLQRNLGGVPRHSIGDTVASKRSRVARLSRSFKEIFELTANDSRGRQGSA
jgi:hypothetical protein